MNQTRLLALVIAAIVAIAGGWYFGRGSLPTQRAAIETGKLMFPDLTTTLPDARRIEITRKGKITAIELKNNVRGVADRGGYPVEEPKLRGLLTALTELRLTEPRTTDPQEFNRLGVEDPTADKAGTANLLRVLDAKGEPIVSVIVGHRRMRTQGNVPEEVYVRKPGDNQSWLAEGSLQADADPQVWLNRAIINISRALITKVVATKNGATIRTHPRWWRENESHAAGQTIPSWKTTKSTMSPARSENLTFQDVKPASEPIEDKIDEFAILHPTDWTSRSRSITSARIRGPASLSPHQTAASPEAELTQCRNSLPGLLRPVRGKINRWIRLLTI